MRCVASGSESRESPLASVFTRGASRGCKSAGGSLSTEKHICHILLLRLTKAAHRKLLRKILGISWKNSEAFVNLNNALNYEHLDGFNDDGIDYV